MIDAVSPASLVVTAAITAVLLIALPRLLLRAGIVDEPGARSSHAATTPRGAGLAVGPAALCGTCIAAGHVLRPAVPVLMAGTIALLLGLTDDLRGLRAATRLVTQILLAGGALAAMAVGGQRLSAVVLGVALIWIVAFTNAFNFMDGINGISAATVIVTGASWTVLATLEDDALLGTVGSVLAVSCLVFLPWNVPRAVIFLGDSGSYFLGTTLAVLVVLAAGRGAPLVALIGPLAIYLTDTGTTLVRRALRKEQLLKAHREHIYQQLADHLGHVRTSLVVGAASAFTGGLGLLTATSGPAGAIGFTGVALGICGAYALSPRVLGRAGPRSPSPTLSFVATHSADASP